MRTPRPLRWIEAAEAREVLALAASEALAQPPPLLADVAAGPSRSASLWSELLRRWLFSAAAATGPDAAIDASPANPVSANDD